MVILGLLFCLIGCVYHFARMEMRGFSDEKDLVMSAVFFVFGIGILLIGIVG